ncbi:metallophosphoesterase [Candidatus Chlorohelix sp.]|uniref:metallophosphoesterase family protein n=1 Tax=Candidatus Chlorohelix sp. TaxID=3139201 RepID=UPI00306F5ACC
MRFVVLGDLHYSVYKTNSLCQIREEYYENLFYSVLEQKPDAVFAIGDTVDNGFPEEFEGLHACARRVGLNFYTVNGNHDLLELPREEIARWTGNRQSYFTLSFDPVTGIANPSNNRFSNLVVLDTVKEKSPKDHGGFVWSEQIEWLKKQIETSENNPIFVFGHHPLKSETLYSSFRMLKIDNSHEIKQVFLKKQTGQGFYFCGHNHANSINRRGNWSFIQTAAPLRTNDFRIIDYTPDQVSLTTVEVKNKNQQNLAKQLTKALGDFLMLPSRGFDADRHLTISLASQEKSGAELLPDDYYKRVRERVA